MSAHRTNQEEKHLVIIGPPHSGEEQCVKRIKAAYQKTVWTISMGNVDIHEVALGLAAQSICFDGKSKEKKFFAWTGYGRNEVQINNLINWGFLTPANSACIMINANETTCGNNLKSYLKAMDRVDTFQNYNLRKLHSDYTQSEGRIQKELGAAGIIPIPINGNLDLGQVSERILSYARRLFPLPIPSPASESPKVHSLVTT